MSVRGLNIAATGMNSAQNYVDIISHNIANGSTTGYKEMQPIFMDLIYDTRIIAGSTAGGSSQPNPAGLQFGLGSNLSATIHNFQQGALIPYTDDPWTIALDGPGLFQVTLSDGSTAYTRNGALVVDADGVLSSVLGYPLSPSLTVPQGHAYIKIDTAGNVFTAMTKDALETATKLGTIELALFVNPAGLQAVGDSLYAETDGSGAPLTGTAKTSGFGVIRQHYLEDSNVNTIKAITDLIKAQRWFEFNSNALQTVSDMIKRETNITA